MSKEEEEKPERKKTPPTPPIRNKGGKGEEESSSCSSACASTEKPVAVFDLSKPPSLETALAFAHQRLDYHDDGFIREWFDQMDKVYMWVHPQTGLRIRHWAAYMRGAIENHQTQKTPAREKRRNHFGKRPVNWLAPTEGEDYANSPF